MASLTPCATPGCPELCRSTHCNSHRPRRARDRRPSAAARGYDAAWRRARRTFLRQHPRCQTHGCPRRSSHVDHVERARHAGVDFWDRTNWQALCETCHRAKSGREAHEPLDL